MNILLIDDDPKCLQSMVSVLEIDGHVCQAFTEPEQALAAYRAATCDAVITDMKMPGMNGIQVLQRIRALNPNARVIIVTAYWDVDTAIAALNNRAYAFLSKPLKLGELMFTLEKIGKEIRDWERIRSEHARLAMEYARLKTAFEDLQALLKKIETSRG